MNKKKMFDLVLTAVLMSIILTMALVPNLGFITIGVAAITLVHIPVLIGVLILPLTNGVILGATFGIGSLISANIQATGPIDLAFQNPLYSVVPRVLFALCVGLIIKLIAHFIKKNKKVLLINQIVSIAIIFGLLGMVGHYFGAQANGHEILGMITGFSVAYLLITLVFWYVNQKDAKDYLSYGFLLITGTVIHTVLVIGFLLIFNSELINQVFGGQNFIDIYYAIISTNGILEATFALLIGLPIIIAIVSNYKELKKI